MPEGVERVKRIWPHSPSAYRAVNCERGLAA